MKVLKKNKDFLNKINLLDMSREKMEFFFNSIGESKFRAIQVMEWIYHHYCDQFELMSNLSVKLRKKLSKIAIIYSPKIFYKKISNDGTIKFVLRMEDNNTVETVYIPEKKRATLCISTQIGCNVGCKFCATAQQGFNRNLKVSEIIGQIWIINRIIHFMKIKKIRYVTNIVFMGMGEPLLNIKNVVESIKIMIDDFGFNFSKKKITLSTSGIVPIIEKLYEMIDIPLALSLHASNDLLRNKIMPINKIYNIQNILNSVNVFLKKSHINKKITIEYVMLKDINDTSENAKELANCLKRVPSKINLIPWNFFPGSMYKSSSKENIINFSNILKKYGFITLIRKNRGNDINAACGQLVWNIKKIF
ncbi:MAG: 23S rRNA (adenine(2503)-C(2))-methyltransferase RlmN [Arsenophonus sp.]|nr:MAG: 23S rRNA (adenine(2503)-C(2))-methyltransferase RlmN [Arsenophonus sp.]